MFSLGSVLPSLCGVKQNPGAAGCSEGEAGAWSAVQLGGVRVRLEHGALSQAAVLPVLLLQ